MEERFLAYDWQQDKLWHDHLSKVCPPPSNDKLKRMKRYWYKIFVDRQFDAVGPSRRKRMKEATRAAPDGIPDLTRLNPLVPRFLSERIFMHRP